MLLKDNPQLCRYGHEVNLSQHLSHLEEFY